MSGFKTVKPDLNVRKSAFNASASGTRFVTSSFSSASGLTEDVAKNKIEKNDNETAKAAKAAGITAFMVTDSAVHAEKVYSRATKKRQKNSFKRTVSKKAPAPETEEYVPADVGNVNRKEADVRQAGFKIAGSSQSGVSSASGFRTAGNLQTKTSVARTAGFKSLIEKKKPSHVHTGKIKSGHRRAAATAMAKNAVVAADVARQHRKTGKKLAEVAAKMLKKTGGLMFKTAGIILVPAAGIMVFVFLAVSLVDGIVSFFTGAGSTKFTGYMDYRIGLYNDNYTRAISDIKAQYPPDAKLEFVGRRADIYDMLYIWLLVTNESKIIDDVTKNTTNLVDSRDFNNIMEFMSPYPTAEDTKYDSEENILTILISNRSNEEAVAFFSPDCSEKKIISCKSDILELRQADITQTVLKFSPITIAESAMNENGTIGGKRYIEYFVPPEETEKYEKDWSLAFIQWCISHCTDDVDRTAVPFGIKDVSELQEHFMAKSETEGGYWEPAASGYIPESGNLIFLKDAAGCSVGIVDRVTNNTVYVIQGNVEKDGLYEYGAGLYGTVNVVEYNLDSSDIEGYALPDYYNVRQESENIG